MKTAIFQFHRLFIICDCSRFVNGPNLRVFLADNLVKASAGII